MAFAGHIRTMHGIYVRSEGCTPEVRLWRDRLFGLFWMHEDLACFKLICGLLTAFCSFWRCERVSAMLAQPQALKRRFYCVRDHIMVSNKWLAYMNNFATVWGKGTIHTIPCHNYTWLHITPISMICITLMLSAPCWGRAPLIAERIASQLPIKRGD